METKNRATVWIVVAALAGLLFGCLGGTLAGGGIGFVLGRESAPTPVQAPFQFRIEPTPFLPEPERPDLEPTPTTPGRPVLLGVAVVTQVVPDSPAERAGIQVGDMITALDGVTLVDASLAELVAGYRPGDVVTLTLLRGGREMDLNVTLGAHPEKGDAAWIGVYYQEMPSGRLDRSTP